MDVAFNEGKILVYKRKKEVKEGTIDG